MLFLNLWTSFGKAFIEFDDIKIRCQAFSVQQCVLGYMSLQRINSIALAKLILSKKGPMSHLKLQKLLYYVEAWHMSILGESIIADDFKAWMHGPVCLSVWHHFKNNVAPLHNELMISEADSQMIAEVEGALDSSQKELIDDVLAEYGEKSAYHLECLTHDETPWIEARKGLLPDQASNNTISKATIRDFYSRLLYGEPQQAQAT